MSVFTTRPVLRWLVPVVVAGVALTAAVAGQALTADADPALPPRSAAQLLVDLQTSSVTGLSGTVVQRADLGLPELPVAVGGQGSSEFAALVSGTHTLRVWYGGEERQRIALLGTLGESDLVRNGSDVWTWSSDTDEVTHYVLPGEDAGDPDRPDPTDLPSTPQEAAEAALAAIDPTTVVTTDGTASVAGRAAYELVLRPRDDASLVEQVRIAVDAEQGVPLRVRVYADGEAAEASLEVGFTQISFAMPGDEHFDFRVPDGATVTEVSAEDLAGAEPAGPEPGEPDLVGAGWTTVAVITAPADGPAEGEPVEGTPAEALLDSLPEVSGAWGSGRLLRSDLLSVLVTDDGLVLAGAVTPERLYDVAAQR